MSAGESGKFPIVSANKKSQQLRIIGGVWRGRKLSFPDLPGLRPSADRVRETLFNWLAPVIAGTRCLDLFAGSGALGLEAASRGAAEVVLVEQDRAVANALRKHIERLSAANVQVREGDALSYLQDSGPPFDVVFVDPPFDAGLLQQSIDALHTGQWLHTDSYVYLEAERGTGISLPQGWELFRSKRAGQVDYHLVRITAG